MSTLATVSIGIICLTLIAGSVIFTHKVKRGHTFTATDARDHAIGNGLTVIALVCFVISEALR